MLKQYIIKFNLVILAIIMGIILIWLVIQSVHNTQSLQQIRQGVITLNHDEFIITQNLERLTQQTSQWQAQEHQDHATALQKIKQFNTTLQGLAQQLNHLNNTVNSLPTTAATTQPTNAQSPLTPSTRQVAAGYHIYAVEPYGVVINTPSGQFHIARVGEVIPKLGQIKSISANQVLVGQHYTIDRE